MDAYEIAREQSLQDPSAFWGEWAEELDWERPWERVLNDSRPPFFRWFTGGRINTCYNAVDRHIAAGHGDAAALIYVSPVAGEAARLTYFELRKEVALLAGAMAERGLRPGSSVLLYMPMVPEAVIAMLACARIGAVHTVVFGGFAAPELAARIDDVQPALVFSASCGIERERIIDYGALLDRALEIATWSPDQCVILERSQLKARMVRGCDLSWDEFVAGAPEAECIPVAATDPLYILHTSGTTGRSKGIVRDNGGHAVGLSFGMKALYGVDAGDVFWAASDIGWVVGHSYIVYGPLLRGCTTVLFEGKPVGTPDAGIFWRVARDNAVAAMFTAPTALRAIRREDPAAELVGGSFEELRTIFVAGERCELETLAWVRERIGVDVVNHWWQTETGWPITIDPIGLPTTGVTPGSVGKPTPGYDVRIVNEQGEAVAAGTNGHVVIRQPLPPGSALTLWRDDERFQRTYFDRFPGFYETGDTGYLDEAGSVHIMGRSDDALNTAGHRLSTGAMEEVIARHPAVAECAVIGVPDELKGEVPVAFVTLLREAEIAANELAAALILRVRHSIGPVASMKRVIVVGQLPKTRSGKVLRKAMRAMASGTEIAIPPTIEDASALVEIRAALDRDIS